MEDRRAVFLLPVVLLLPWAHGCLAVTCGQTVSINSETSSILKIIGGEPADIREFPWQVNILERGRHLCGGSILSEWWILTAAHCLNNRNKSDLEIIHGDDDGNLSTRNLTKMKVDRLIIHSYFDSWLLDNDIALVLLQSPFTWGVTKVPICLTEVTNLKRWRNCKVSGSGVTSSRQQLHKVGLRLFKRKKCSRVLPLFTRNMLCAGNRQAGMDACQGDSGGPLVCQKKHGNVWYQLGIVSWGAGCGLKNLPGVYTKVANYLSWIHAETTLSGRPYTHKPDPGCRLLPSSWAILSLPFATLLLTS